MQSFTEIYDRAAERKGGEAALEGQLAEWRSKPRDEVAATPDDRWLSQMSRGVFQAGFNWRVIDNKWPGFEAAFHGFDPQLNAAMSEDEFDAHLKDTRIVRNAQKVASVRANGQFLVDLAREHGSAARSTRNWALARTEAIFWPLRTIRASFRCASNSSSLMAALSGGSKP